MSKIIISAAERYAEQETTKILNDKHPDVRGIIFHALVNAYNKGYDCGMADGICAGDNIENSTL